MARPSPITNSARSNRSTHRGFTLAECLIASVVLSVTVFGVCGALTTASAQVSAMEVEAHSLSLARQLSEEIAARSFDPPASNDNPGWPQGSALRVFYDNIADYNGLVEYFEPPSTATGAIDTLEYMRATSVQFRSSPSGPADASGDYAMITVTVTPSANAGSFTLKRLVTRTNIVRE